MMMSTKNTILSERNSPTSSNSNENSYTEDHLDKFQRELNREKIIDIWKKMREGGNSKDGIVTKEKFTQIFKEHFEGIKDSLIKAIFERFGKRDPVKDERSDKRRSEEKKSKNENEITEIDLHDLVVSLALISHLHYDEKLELVFDLTDIDEDGCLSPDDICKMILAIERNFAKESSLIDPGNASSLYNVATKKALRRFNYIFLYENQGVPDSEKGSKGRRDKLLGHFKDFLEKLSDKKNLYSNLLPKNHSLKRILETKPKEVEFTINRNSEDQFKKFRSELHGKLWGGTYTETKLKGLNSKKDDIIRFQNKEPGEVLVEGTKIIEEEPRVVENVQENIKQKEYTIQERINYKDHEKRLKEMKEKSYPNLREVMKTKYETTLKKKETHLPPLIKTQPQTEIKPGNIQIPDLASLIEKRVERLKKQYKYLDNNYKDYLLNKLTSSITERDTRGTETERPSPTKKYQPYKFLL